MATKSVRTSAFASSLFLFVTAFAGCSSDDDHASGPVTCATPGGPRSGAADTHCGSTAVTIDPATCGDGAGTSFSPRLHLMHPGHEHDAGPGKYGPTMSNAEGDDDECKYHVKWEPASDTQVCANGDIFFNVTITNKADGTPARSVPILPNAYLNETHPSVPRHVHSDETTTPGVYRAGPIRFDAQGDWTMRLHLHAECADGDHSPHGHATFFVAVP